MKKQILSLAVVLFGIASLSSCLNDDDPQLQPTQTPIMTRGLFILNEGNMAANVSGSLSYLNFTTGQMQQNVFSSINQRFLGDTPNSMLVVDSKMFIAVTGENRVEVNDQNLHATTPIEIRQPREMDTDGKYVYITNYDGIVTKVDVKSLQIVATSPVIGDNLEGIAYQDGRLYVCNSYNDDYTYNNTLVRLNAETMEKTGEILVATNPTKVIATDSRLYVLSMGNYADVRSQVQVIEGDSQAVRVCDGTLFDVYHDTLYVINSVIDWTQGKANNEYFAVVNGDIRILTPLCDVPYPCSLAIDPNSGVMFVGSYAKGATGLQDFAGEGNLYVFNFQRNVYDKFATGVGPTTLYFISAAYSGN